jgi:hypothetical protein
MYQTNAPASLNHALTRHVAGHFVLEPVVQGPWAVARLAEATIIAADRVSPTKTVSSFLLLAFKAIETRIY